MNQTQQIETANSSIIEKKHNLRKKYRVMAGGYWAENKHFHISSGVLTISSNGLYITLPSVNGFEFDTVNKRILFRFNGILAAQIRDKTLIKEILKIAEEVSD